MTVNISALADACSTSTETVSSLLTGIRDEIVDFVVVRKINAYLNFGFGILSLR